MSDIKIIKSGIDVSEIKNILEKNPQDWTANFGIKEASHNRIQDVGVLQLKMGIVSDPKQFVGNSEQTVKTLIYNKYKFAVESTLSKLGITEFDRAAFLMLGVDKHVGLHIDEGTYYLTRDRFHLSISGVYEYVCGDYEATIFPGTLFWFDNKKEHGAINISDEPRITLVFDVPHSQNNPQHGIS